MEIFTSILIALTTVIFIVYVYSKIVYKYWEKKKFPYLVPKFPYGNSKSLIKVSVTFNLHTMTYYDDIKKNGWKFGGVYDVMRPLLIVIDPETMGDILTRDFSYFTDRGFYYNKKGDPLSANLFTFDSCDWRNMRAKLTPVFTSGKMRIMLSSILSQAKNLIMALDEYAENNEDIAAKDTFANFTADVIGSVAFGLEANSFKNNHSEFREATRVVFEPEGLFHILKLSMTVCMPKLARILGVTTARKDIREFFNNWIPSTVKYREEQKVRRPDFLQLLIDMKKDGNAFTMDQIMGQAFMFFVAGFDTSSTAMTMAMYELAQNSDLQEKIRREINEVLEKYEGEVTYESLNEMTLLQQALDETLRLYPPLPNIQRVCIKDYRLKNTDLVIEKGTQIVIPIISLHRDAEYYPNPLKFDPSRFSKENNAERPSNVYLPFGVGPRNCIGYRFGQMQSKIGLVEILRRFRISISPTTKMPLTINKSNFIFSTNETLYLRAERIYV